MGREKFDKNVYAAILEKLNEGLAYPDLSRESLDKNYIMRRQMERELIPIASEHDRAMKNDYAGLDGLDRLRADTYWLERRKRALEGLGRETSIDSPATLRDEAIRAELERQGFPRRLPFDFD